MATGDGLRDSSLLVTGESAGLERGFLESFNASNVVSGETATIAWSSSLRFFRGLSGMELSSSLAVSFVPWSLSSVEESVAASDGAAGPDSVSDDCPNSSVMATAAIIASASFESFLA